jgi:predicted Fe-Mo cluster-binding NifX family protein
MKILVTSTGDTMDSPIDPRFGRAAKFMLVDTETGESEVVDNTQNLNAAQGAGIQSATTVSKLGAQYVITGNCGPKAFRTLEASGIKVITGAGGTVAQVVEKFKTGGFSTSGGPNVEGHWS